MRIVHFSDIHIGSHDAGLVDALADTTNALTPDLVIASGDFAMAARRWELREAAALLARLDAPIVATPGNHDLPVYDLVSRFVRPLARYNRWIEPLSQRSYTDERIAVLGLNSARAFNLSLNWSHGRLGRDQIREADRFFEGCADCAFRALVVHHPFFVPDDLPGFRRIGRGDAMLRVLAERRVHAVFSGHLHKRGTIGRTLEIGAGPWTVHLLQVGSATSSRQREGDGPGGNGFNLIEIDPGAMRVTPFAASGTGFERRDEEAERIPLG